MATSILIEKQKAEKRVEALRAQLYTVLEELKVAEQYVTHYTLSLEYEKIGLES